MDSLELNYTVGIVGRLRDGKFPLSAEEIAMLNDVYEYQNPGETTGDYNNITSLIFQAKACSPFAFIFDKKELFNGIYSRKPCNRNQI